MRPGSASYGKVARSDAPSLAKRTLQIDYLGKSRDNGEMAQGSLASPRWSDQCRRACCRQWRHAAELDVSGRVPGGEVCRCRASGAASLFGAPRLMGNSEVVGRALIVSARTDEARARPASAPVSASAGSKPALLVACACALHAGLCTAGAALSTFNARTVRAL